MATAETYHHSSRVNHLNHFISGELAGMVGAIVAHPFDTIKTRIQIEMVTTIPLEYRNNTYMIFKHIIINDKFNGIKNIYKGVLSPFLGYGLSSSLAFGTNSICKSILIKRKKTMKSKYKNKNKNKLTLFEIMMCGAITGFFHTFLITPIERIKIWSQSHQISSISSSQMLYRKHGFFNGFYRGISVSAMFQIWSYSFYFLFYELSLKMLSIKKNKKLNKYYYDYNIGDIYKNKNKNGISSIKIFVSGGIAGIISWIVGYPIDTLKTIVQSGKYPRHESRISTLQIVQKHYVRCLSFNGIMPALYRAALLHSCVFLMYERVLRNADKYNTTFLVW